MSDEYEYVFIDKSGHCFEDYQLCSKTSPKDEIDKMVDKEFGKDTEGGEKIYRDKVGAMLRASNNGEHNFSVGDMLVFRDDLVKAGFNWGTDFYVKKVRPR